MTLLLRLSFPKRIDSAWEGAGYGSSSLLSARANAYVHKMLLITLSEKHGGKGHFLNGVDLALPSAVSYCHACWKPLSLISILRVDNVLEQLKQSIQAWEEPLIHSNSSHWIINNMLAESWEGGRPHINDHSLWKGASSQLKNLSNSLCTRMQLLQEKEVTETKTYKNSDAQKNLQQVWEENISSIRNTHTHCHSFHTWPPVQVLLLHSTLNGSLFCIPY